MIERVKASMGMLDNLRFRIKSRLKKLYVDPATDIHSIPVIINNFNRLDWLKQQINWLELAGLNNIFIIDNNSGYVPLQAFYRQTKYSVFLLDRNVGFEALWKTIIFQRFKHCYYIYTDPDIIPKEDCPFNAVGHFYGLLQKYPDIDKVGFGLAIDDLPEHYPLKEKVIAWEHKFHEKAVVENVYEAPIDTTFALYRPGAKGGSELKAIRTGKPYIARHMSWYIDPAFMTEEENYYVDNAGISGSWAAELKGNERGLHY